MAGFTAFPSSQDIGPVYSDTMAETDSFTMPSRAHPFRHDGIETQMGFSGMLNLQSIEEFDLQNPHRPKPKYIPLQVEKTNGEQTTKLQHLCDQHGVRPIFTFEEIHSQAFSATVEIRLGTDTIKERIEEPKPSKKHAKEEVCRLAIARMPPVDKMHGIEKDRRKKRKASDDVGGVESTNWVGVLQGI